MTEVTGPFKGGWDAVAGCIVDLAIAGALEAGEEEHLSRRILPPSVPPN
jgi:hypothetical protein